VRFDDAGATLADAATLLEAPVVLVSRQVLAALNHAALACEALAARGSGCAGLAIGGVVACAHRRRRSRRSAPGAWCASRGRDA
jgi:dethiobiotin synthetase